jgi:hypothetical protein
MLRFLVRDLSPHHPDVLALREAQASRAALRQGPMRHHPPGNLRQEKEEAIRVLSGR